MAKLIKNKGKSTYDLYRKRNPVRVFFAYLLLVVSIILSYYTKGISLVFSPLFFLVRGKSVGENEAALKSGEEGEKKTTKILKKLPHSYFVLEDVTIYKENGSNQLDHIVIGPNGIFTIETKNYIGVISGDDSDVKILQQKISTNGKTYEKRYLNPALQVKTHIRAIKRATKPTLFREIEPIGVVFFSNKNAKIKMKSKEVKICSNGFLGGYRLRKYIRKYPNDIFLDINDRRDLVSILR